MNLYAYLAKLKEEPGDTWDPHGFLALSEDVRCEAPGIVACVMLDGTKGGYVVPEGIPPTWNNRMFVDAITTNIAQPNRIEIVSAYRMPENARRGLRLLGASLFSTHVPQTTYASVKVYLTPKDSPARARYLILEALKSL